jgi:hypothetical protein
MIGGAPYHGCRANRSQHGAACAHTLVPRCQRPRLHRAASPGSLRNRGRAPPRPAVEPHLVFRRSGAGGAVRWSGSRRGECSRSAPAYPEEQGLTRARRAIVARVGLVATAMLLVSATPASPVLATGAAGTCEEKCGGWPSDSGCSPGCADGCCISPMPGVAESTAESGSRASNPHRWMWDVPEPVLSSPVDGVFHPPNT